MPLKRPQASIPGPFKALTSWLRFRRGLDLSSRINFTRGLTIGNVDFTPADAKKLKAFLSTMDEPEPEPKPKLKPKPKVQVPVEDDLV